ncbi:MAG: hypothetical protein KJO24_03975 [Gammaproteobacteria bacterium]|nr:hypothetical protein [Gammaproteobacteria bacterium]
MSNNFQLTNLVSTSALAKKLDLPAKTIFELLVDKGWIERIDKHWKLTGKGQFEGGDYVTSKKFGEYIGWPEAVLEHVIFDELFNRPLRTRIIAQELGISAHRFNALLAELGWQQRFHRGWILTPLGRQLGGKEREDDESGVPFTLWPRTVLEQERLAVSLAALRPANALAGEGAPHAANDAAQDQQALDFDSSDMPSNLRGMDGHQLEHIEDLLLDNWFYLMGVTHAYQRSLPDAELGDCDFYLPAAHLYIECWHAKDTGSLLSAKLARIDYYKDNKLEFYEVSTNDLQNLDTVLPKLLLKHGITVF